MADRNEIINLLEQLIEANLSESTKLNEEKIKLENEVVSLKQRVQELEQQLEERASKDILRNLDKLFKRKLFFYHNEQSVYFSLRDFFDEKKIEDIGIKNEKAYVFFPKVRLQDVFEEIDYKKNIYDFDSQLYEKSVDNIKDKFRKMHVDFIVCKFVSYVNEIGLGSMGFMPYLGIEINGKHHIDDINTQINDEFKATLFKTFNIPLISYEILNKTDNTILQTLKEKIKIELKQLEEFELKQLEEFELKQLEEFELKQLEELALKQPSDIGNCLDT